VRKIDVRKPVHAIAIGGILAGILAPTLAWMADNERYRLNDRGVADVITKSNSNLTAKLSYDKSKAANIFNASGDWDVPGGDRGAISAGGGGKKDKQLYTATMPDDSSTGIKVSDNVNKTSVTMTPDYSLMGGRVVSGHVVYPIKNQAAQLVFTPKANGLKEDILLNRVAGDTASYDYELNLKDGLDARLMPDGTVGIYSADPALFGSITFSTPEDQKRVETARENGAKTYLMYQIPAPVIKQSGSGSYDGVRAHFKLSGNSLTVVAQGLAAARYPLSIDPSFVVTTSSDFNLGRVEDNITVTTPNGTDGQINRAAITGGLTDAWASTSNNLPAACGTAEFNFAMTAYNGNLYLAGGGNTATSLVCYASINATTGALGNWGAITGPTGCASNCNAFSSNGRTAASVVGDNGYIYVIGGESANGNTYYTEVDYASIDSSGDITCASHGTAGTTSCFNTTGTLATSRAYAQAAVYNDHVYICGGAHSKNDGNLRADCEYSTVNADGSLANFTATSSFTTARDYPAVVTYNGYIYVIGGGTGAAVFHDVQYAPIKSDGTLGTFVTNGIDITGAIGGWRNGGATAEEGYMYLIGGCNGVQSCATPLTGTYYAPFNADGSMGRWEASGNSITTGRFGNGGASYNGALYTTSGCTSQPASGNNCNATTLSDTQYTKINASVNNTTTTMPGEVVAPAAGGNTFTTAREGAAVTAYNGYLYAAGGCTTGAANEGCTAASATVSYATIQDDGSLSTWTDSGNTLPGGTGMYGAALVGYGGKLYFLGGSTAGGTGSQTVYSDTITSGNPQTWATDSTTTANDKLVSNRYWASAYVYQNYIYLVGGKNNGGALNTVEYTQISASGAYSAPTNCASQSPAGTLSNSGTGVWCQSGNTMANSRSGPGFVAADGYLYVFGGDNAGTFTTSMERSTLGSNGYPGSWTTSSSNVVTLPNARAYMSAAIVNNVLYAWDGLSSTSAVSNALYYAPIDSSGNAVGTSSGATTWTTSARTGVTSRWGAGGGSYNGRFYNAGGCSSASSTCSAYLNTTEVGLPRNGQTGMTSQSNASSWTGGTALPTATADFASVAYNGNVYVIGGCTGYTSGVCTTSSGFSTQVTHSAIGSDGSLGAWTATNGTVDTQLPAGRSYNQAVAYNGFIYLVGGLVSGPSVDAKVYVGTISSTGTITAWNNNSGSYDLPTSGRVGFGAATSNGFIYVAGGCTAFTSSTCTSLKQDVIFSQFGPNGAMVAPQNCSGGSISGVWCTGSVTFTTTRYDMQAVAYGANLYVIGGYDSTNNDGDVQYASINATTGAVGSFSTTNFQDLYGRARPALGANGFMYFFGNETTGTDVKYMPINANGTLGNLEHGSTNGMTNAHTHGVVDFYNGYFYAMGGCTVASGTCGAVNTNTEYVGQKANARIGHYSKLFNTVVNTAPSQVVLNGSGQYTVQMQTAAQGATSLGKAQNFSPAYPAQFYTLQALDSSGTNVGIALNYYIFLTIDDSQSGTFPDTTSSQSYVTDINIFYHANPNYRLRHGASFTTTGCSGVLGAAQGCILDTAP
jgi:hypothetical protein